MTRRWREVDSNPRSPVRKLAPDIGTPTIIDGMRPRKSGSQRTRRWRKWDSNRRSPDGRRDRVLQPKRCPNTITLMMVVDKSADITVNSGMRFESVDI
jgi:hypothetical protein